MIAVAIIDDHKLVTEGIAEALKKSPFITICGIAHCAKQGLEKMQFWKPDVVILDISLPDISGIEFTAILLEKFPSLKIIALSTHSEYSIVKQMLDNGAMGYVLKNESTDIVLKAIATLTAGEIFISQETALILKLPEHKRISLTQREKEILSLISEGLTNAEIAEKIFLSPETIKSYRKNLLFKLDAKNTALLIKKSLELKLI